MRSRSYLFLLIVLGLALVSGFLYTRVDYKLGLDVQGGVRLIYHMDTTKLKREDVPRARSLVQTILEARVAGPMGVAEGSVQLKGTDQVVVELPGFIDVDKARQTIGTTASLEWYHAKNVTTAGRPRAYEIGEQQAGNKPEVTFIDTHTDKDIKPGDPEYAKMIEGWELILQGSELAQAMAVQSPGGGYVPGFKFNREGARKMRRWTTRYRDRQENLAAVLDGVVISIAPLKQGAVIEYEGQIDGNFDTNYVKNLVNLLNSGALPVKLDELSAQKVDPVVGQHALDKILFAGAISFLVIGGFMVVYYVFPGIVASAALILYILFSLTALKLGNATFSLAAIAGFILSVGMAVDANILVFERVKEELRSGRPLEKAIDIGFKRALTAIVDSNVCTILTSAVLAYLGTGPVKGFATTLIIGVAISLFTAITVTRSLLVFLVGSGLGANPKWYGLNRQWFGEGLEHDANRKPLQIVNRWKLYFAISVVMIVPGLIFYLGGGLKKNVEFQGGFQVEVEVPQGNTLTNSQIVANLEKAGIKGANAQFMEGAKDTSTGSEGDDTKGATEGAPAKGTEGGSSGTEVIRLVGITVPSSGDLTGAGAPRRIADAAGLQGQRIVSYSEVGETIRAETVWNAILGIVLASGLIVVYLAIRFGIAVGGFLTGLRFSISAIGAMGHDVLVVVGLAAIAGGLWGWEISSLFLTAVLTMIGFSTHDTIVIFDRIRENLRRPHPNETFENLVNRSITQSFARSLNTSGTVIVTLIILIIWGSATMDLKFFNLAMLVGIISGTYSSIYNASPILYLWDKAVASMKGQEATLMAVSEKEILHTRSTVSTTVAEPKPTDADDKARAYGQVRRRRASAVQRSQQNVDDDK